MTTNHGTAAKNTMPKAHAVYTIAIIGFIYTLHLVIPMYSNSSFLELFADERTVGFIYMAGAAVTIFGFLLAPPFIRRLGNYRTALWLIIIQAILFYGLITASSPEIIAACFILQTATIALIGLCLDIFLEVYTDGRSVGTVRGLYTATLNASWVVAPLIGTMLINGTNNYKNTYIAALAMLLPLLYLIYRNFPRFKDPNYTHLSPHQLVKHVSNNTNWIKLFSANTILQTFYAWMTVYTPIYLHQIIGFSWEEIGIILIVMLLPFPLIQYPLGKLADKKYGEKEIMSVGFALMGLSTVGLAFLTAHNVMIWALALALTRIGAAAAEIMMETYFFKTVSPRDSAALGVFRITRPVSYFTGPLVGIIGLLFLSSQWMFAVVGVISLFALIPSMTIRDTN
ncbi:MAG: MFS transporter [Patescibacteria group bacterium]|nr:MFS transporter [Patescibacteria group bacterium]